MTQQSWLLVIVIGVVMLMAMLAAAWLRQRHLQRKVRLEIVNQGNVRSRYQLRAADPASDLSFGFSLGGDPLPEQAVFDEDLEGEVAEDTPVVSSAPETLSVPPSAPGAERGVQQSADQATRRASSLAGTLTALGTTLPRPLGAPLMRAASQLQRGQIRVSRAQQVPRRVASFRPKSAAPAVRQAGAVAGPAESAQPVGSTHRSVARVWAETPSLAPGEALILDLLIRSASTSKDQQYTFQVVSRSVEGKDVPWVVTESSVQIRGGFWARRFLPQIIIVALAMLLAFAVLAPSLFAS